MSRDRRQKDKSPSSPRKVQTCANCEQDIIHSDKAIKCNDCFDWYHQKCTELTTQEFNLLTKGNKHIKYQCVNCLSGDETSRFLKLESRIDKLESEAEAAKNESCDIKDIVKQLQTQNENIQRQNDMILKFFDNYKGENLENKIKAHVNELTDDKMDMKDKENNMIVFNLEESKGPSAEENDVVRVKELFKVTNPDLNTDYLTKETVFRLRKKPNPNHADDSTKCAPIKVKLPNVKTKMQILSNGRKLKGHQQFGKVGIQMDMSKAEQEKHKAIRTELNERRQKGEEVMIFDGRIILKKDREAEAAKRAELRKKE